MDDVYTMEKIESTELEVGKGVTRTIKQVTPCGNLYIAAIYEDTNPDKIEYVKIYFSNRMGKCGSAMHESIADTLTFSIRRIRNKFEARSICKNLRDHQCNAMPLLSKNRNKSCVDAIGRAVMTFLEISEDELRGRV